MHVYWPRCWLGGMVLFALLGSSLAITPTGAPSGRLDHSEDVIDTHDVPTAPSSLKQYEYVAPNLPSSLLEHEAVVGALVKAHAKIDWDTVFAGARLIVSAAVETVETNLRAVKDMALEATATAWKAIAGFIKSLMDSLTVRETELAAAEKDRNEKTKLLQDVVSRKLKSVDSADTFDKTRETVTGLRNRKHPVAPSPPSDEEDVELSGAISDWLATEAVYRNYLMLYNLRQLAKRIFMLLTISTFIDDKQSFLETAGVPHLKEQPVESDLSTLLLEVDAQGESYLASQSLSSLKAAQRELSDLIPDIFVEGVEGSALVINGGIELVTDFATCEVGLFTKHALFFGTKLLDLQSYWSWGWKRKRAPEPLARAYSGWFTGGDLTAGYKAILFQTSFSPVLHVSAVEEETAPPKPVSKDPISLIEAAKIALLKPDLGGLVIAGLSWQYSFGLVSLIPLPILGFDYTVRECRQPVLNKATYCFDTEAKFVTALFARGGFEAVGTLTSGWSALNPVNYLGTAIKLGLASVTRMKSQRRFSNSADAALRDFKCGDPAATPRACPIPDALRRVEIPKSLDKYVKMAPEFLARHFPGFDAKKVFDNIKGHADMLWKESVKKAKAIKDKVE